MTLLEENHANYTAVFMGTIQHSLSFDLKPLIKVGLFVQHEFVRTILIRATYSLLTADMKIGDVMSIAVIAGNALKGYEAVNDDVRTLDDVVRFQQFFKRLTAVKNVGCYQLLDVERENDMDNYIKAPDLTGRHLALLRSLYGLSQTAFADSLGFSRSTLAMIESEKRVISGEIVEKIQQVYPDLATALELQFDWLSVTFRDLTGLEVIEKVLQMKPVLFLERDTKQNFYTREYAYGGEKQLYVQDNVPEYDRSQDREVTRRGATLYLTGQGTRLFEMVLLEQGISWKQFIVRMRQYGGTFSRVDVAINDKWGLLDLNEIVLAVQTKRFWSKTRSYAIHGNDVAGWTVNFGKSPFVIRIYDKQKEQLQKGLETDIKTRVELELRKERAEYLINEWLDNDTLVETTLSILKSYLWFVAEDIPDVKRAKLRNRDDYVTQLKPLVAWELLVSLGSLMKFTTDPKDTSLVSIKEWVLKYVVPSLKVLQDTGNWPEILDAISQAELSAEQEKLVQAATISKRSVNSLLRQQYMGKAN
ncbi:XRE family transcriptional regulator [Weissella confusa]|uniref:replication initiation factor domain-containing protein n=1 Tax=Weissella confusa TaxID=1583 RepID=UPI001C6FBDFC|nr:replication initiation factor domain-containing protein [Weissella confusa]QYU58828.1 XRE family transcriptional regulator [Weissella confusa]